MQHYKSDFQSKSCNKSLVSPRITHHPALVLVVKALPGSTQPVEERNKIPCATKAEGARKGGRQAGRPGGHNKASHAASQTSLGRAKLIVLRNGSNLSQLLQRRWNEALRCDLADGRGHYDRMTSVRFPTAFHAHIRDSSREHRLQNHRDRVGALFVRSLFLACTGEEGRAPRHLGVRQLVSSRQANFDTSTSKLIKFLLPACLPATRPRRPVPCRFLATQLRSLL